jgi:hypothetical protein
MANRRTSKRLEIAIPLRIKLLGINTPPPVVDAVTRNISAVGISTQLPVTLTNGGFCIREREKQVNLIPYLAQEDKEVEIELTVPPHKERVSARGKIVWYTLGTRQDSYVLGAGIALSRLEGVDRKQWGRFVKETALKTGKIWQYIHVVSIVFFVAGIVIFLTGLRDGLTTTASGGMGLSVAGLIGFLLAWWQHQCFKLLKKF